jgi:hypothetical protein
VRYVHIDVGPALWVLGAGVLVVLVLHGAVLYAQHRAIRRTREAIERVLEDRPRE